MTTGKDAGAFPSLMFPDVCSTGRWCPETLRGGQGLSLCQINWRWVPTVPPSWRTTGKPARGQRLPNARSWFSASIRSFDSHRSRVGSCDRPVHNVLQPIKAIRNPSGKEICLISFNRLASQFFGHEFFFLVSQQFTSLGRWAPPWASVSPSLPWGIGAPR